MFITTLWKIVCPLTPSQQHTNILFLDAAFIFLATFAMAMNAAAGCAAATIGAKINHKLLTPQVVRPTRRPSGSDESRHHLFCELVLMSPINFVFRMLLLLMLSSFGICLVLTAEVCNIVLEESGLLPFFLSFLTWIGVL